MFFITPRRALSRCRRMLLEAAASVARSALAALLVGLCFAAQADTLHFQVDTTPLAGRTGYLALDLTQGSAASINQLTLSNFASTSLLGAGTSSGNVTGSLPGAVTFQSSVFFSELLQAVTFAPGFTFFSLTFGTNHLPGDIPDSFALFLLDNLFVPFTTADPTGASALIAIDLQQPVVTQIYASPWAIASQVPEPSASALGLLGLVLLTAWRQREPLQKILKPTTR